MVEYLSSVEENLVYFKGHGVCVCVCAYVCVCVFPVRLIFFLFLFCTLVKVSSYGIGYSRNKCSLDYSQIQNLVSLIS